MAMVDMAMADMEMLDLEMVDMETVCHQYQWTWTTMKIRGR